jgi:hypothetical protein
MHMSAGSQFKREMRVAFSRRAQPVWFRLLKWIVIITLVFRFHGSPWFWWYTAGVLMLCAIAHFIWRWKTKVWTQPWGGWSDVEAAEGLRPHAAIRSPNAGPPR